MVGRDENFGGFNMKIVVNHVVISLTVCMEQTSAYPNEMSCYLLKLRV